jgi:hypothetical protein
MKHSSIYVGLVVSLLASAGCSRNPTSPSVPSAPSVPPGPAIFYTLTGVVFVQTPDGPEPAKDVRVSVTGSTAGPLTAGDGSYTIAGLSAGPHTVSATRPDIVTVSRVITISGDTHLDVEVVEKPSFTLSGVVFERTATGTAPIENVEVYCDSCGSPYGHTFAHTDAHGFYSFSYTFPGANPLLIRRAGYGDPPGQPPGPVAGSQWRVPIVIGDTRFDIELVSTK